MSTAPDWDGYRLMRDTASSVRLNAQHYFWKQTCGFNVHPSLPIPSNRKLRIADIGTGTAVWLIEVARDTGSHIDGFDKSQEQCPPSELIPEGCTVRKLDILAEDIPEDLKEVYDIVHVRLIQGGLKDTPVPALKNMIAMLKPGGYLQWQEINIGALALTSVKPGLENSNIASLLKEVPAFGFGKWVPRLAEICKENGLLDASTHLYRVPPELGIAFCQTQFLVYGEISRVIYDNSSPEAKGPKLRRLIEKAKTELNSGVWIDHSFEVTVARKAT